MSKQYKKVGSKFKRIYGMTIREISAKMGCSIQEVSVLHKYGYLREQLAMRAHSGNWRKAIGAAKGFLGDELPEDVIRRARGD